jgi:hypothetical protein
MLTLSYDMNIPQSVITLPQLSKTVHALLLKEYTRNLKNMPIEELRGQPLRRGNRSALNPNRQMAIPSFKLLANTLFTLKYTHFCTPIVIVNNPKAGNVIYYLSSRLNSGRKCRFPP